MSGRRRQGISPTLFPFLAVLVCTLGTLILLLALVSQKATEAAAASVVQAAAPVVEDVADEQEQAQAVAQIDRQLREAKWYREQTVKMRDEQTAELEQRRDQLAHLEDHVARLREQLRLLTAEVEASLDDKGTVLTAQATLDQLLGEIEDEKAAIAKLETELQSQTPRIVIVPHKGPNGTDRRPIYVQCRSDGVYLQPGGQRIGRAQLEASSTHANPLDAALRAIRLHAMQTYGDSVAPYPLLIISPEGIETYGLARAAMNAWDDQFGYELVPEGTELAFPPNDPVLEDKVATAIAQAVAQQEAFALRGGGRGRGGTGAGGAGTGGSPRAASLPVLSAAQMSRGGLPATTGFAGVSGADASGAALSGGPDPEDFGQYGSSQSNGSGQTAAGGMRGATGTTAAGGVGEAARAGEIGRDGGPTVGSLQPGAAQDGSSQTAMQPGGQAPSATQPQPAALAAQNMTLNPPQGADATADGSPTAGQPTAANAPSTTGKIAGAPAAGGVSSGSPGGPGGPQASGNESLAGAVDPQQVAGAPSISVGGSPTPPVTRVGKDWGLPSSLISSRGTEMLRMIRVECHPDRFVLLPEGGRGANRTFAFTDGDVDRATLELATAVRDRAASWGAAMQGARWQPVLDVAVVTGGEGRYQQLLQLMEGSGVIIQARGTR